MIFDSLLDYQHDDLNNSTETIISKNTVQNQGYVALGLTDKILRLKRVEVSYDGTTWVPAERLNESEVSESLANQTSINNAFSTNKPFYSHRGQLLYLYPVPPSAVTGGVKLWVDRETTDITAGDVTTGTKEPGFDEPFHIMIALGMCLDWFSAKGIQPQIDAISAELNDYEERLRKAYGRKNADTMSFTPAYVNYK